MTQPETVLAPHGRDANGTPLTPYGLTVQGNPRKSNRGARPGQRGNKNGTMRSSAPTRTGSNLSDQDRKGMLTELADMFITGPLASASQVPFIAKYIGPRQTDALAGDAFIISQYLPAMADGAILMAKTKPGLLAWLDKLENAAPQIILASAVLEAGKAVIANHFNPNPRVAAAGRHLAAIKIARMAERVNEEAARMQAATEEAADKTMNMTVDDFEQAGYNHAMADAA